MQKMGFNNLFIALKHIHISSDYMQWKTKRLAFPCDSRRHVPTTRSFINKYDIGHSNYVVVVAAPEIVLLGMGGK